MMSLRRALISAVTLFGGHFLNRRLDRVVLLGALLVVPALAFLVVLSAVFFTGQAGFIYINGSLKVPVILIGALALLSAGLTFRDAQQPPGVPLTITMRITGAALSLVGVLLMAAVLVVGAMRVTLPRETETGSAPVVRTAGHRPFHGYVSFGGNSETWDLPAPPSGPEHLRGRITLDGAGVEGVTLAIALNGKYKVEHVTPDVHGLFEVALPAGNWRVNGIDANEREGRGMDRPLVLFSGHEPKKGPGPYTRYSFLTTEGLEVHLPSTSSAPVVNLELRDALAMTWPPRSDSFGVRASEPNADFSTAAITWQPVKGASEYEVQITHVTREGTTTSFSPILTRRVSGLTLPLATLPQRSASSDPADEYSVHVYAFDAAGALLTENSMDLDDRMFKLAGGTRLGKEQQYLGRPGPQVISVEYETNELRLSLAAKLLDQKQLDEARRLLDQVTKDAPPGRAPALRGRLAALKGDCVTAIKLFDAADAEGGPGCASIEDRKLCAAPQH